MELEKHMEELIVRFIADNLNDLERIQVKNWIDESVENRQYFEEMKKYYQLTKLVRKPGGFNKEEGWERVKAGYYKIIYLNKSKSDYLKTVLSSLWQELNLDKENERVNMDHVLHKLHYQLNTIYSKSEKSPIQRIAKWTLRVAAGLIILLGVYFGGTLANKTKGNDLAWAEIKAPAWSRVKFNLPDGTSGSLNSNSVLRYNLNFRDKREIELTGEAYFDVYKDKNRPFRLNTNDISLEVTGTHFNVASYPDEDQTEVVLAEGSLNLRDRANTINYKVVPSDLYIYSRTKNSFRKEVVQTEKYTSWTQGKLVFRNDPIDEVARRLGRWYNVDVEVKPGEFSDLRLRATFVEENLEEVLKLLKLNLPINYKIEKRKQDTDGTYQKIKVIISLRK